MQGVKVWLAFVGNVSGKLHRKLVEGAACEIRGVTMVVHKVKDGKHKTPKWRISDPFTGYSAGNDSDTRKKAIANLTEYVMGLEASQARPFTEIMDDCRQRLGKVTDLPERETDATEKPMPA